MIGALIGDIVGHGYEGIDVDSKNFELFNEESDYTDDSVLTVAVMETLLDNYPINYGTKGQFYIGLDVVDNMIKYVKKDPYRSYGKMFYKWATNKVDHEPYESFGNGSAMRISSVGWIANSEEEVKILSNSISEVTHNHPEGIKGAEAIAMCIYLARNGKSKKYIKEYVINNYYPHLNKISYEDLLEHYHFDCTCEGSVPEAIYCFLISEDFEDCLRTAITIGGDTDTICAMSCSIAEAYYKEIPSYIEEYARSYLSDEMIYIIDKFNKIIL